MMVFLTYNEVEVGGTYSKDGQKVLVLNKHQVNKVEGIEYRYVYKLGQSTTEYSDSYRNDLKHYQVLVNIHSATAA